MLAAAEICARAAALVQGERQTIHGDKVQCLQNIADLWSAYLGATVAAHDAALMLVLLKVARTKTGTYNVDDYVDVAGYAGCAGEIAGRHVPA